MSAQGWIGRTLRIGLNGEVLAAVRAKSVRYANTPIDITDGERNGYRRLAEVGDVRSIEVSVDGVTTTDNWPVLRDLVDAEEFAALTIENPDGTAVTSDAVIGGLSRTGEHAGMVTFSATFQLSGTLAEGDYLTSEVYAPEPVEPPEEPYAPELVAEFSSPLAPIALSWTFAVFPTTDVEGYRVEVSVNGGGFSELAEVGPEVSNYDDESGYIGGDEITYRVVAFSGASELTSNTAVVDYTTLLGEFTITAGWDSVAGVKGLYTEDESPPLTYLFGTLDASDLTPIVKACGTLTSVSPDTYQGLIFQLIHTAGLPQDYFATLVIPGVGTFQSAGASDHDSYDAGGGNWVTFWQFPALPGQALMVPSNSYACSLFV